MNDHVEAAITHTGWRVRIQSSHHHADRGLDAYFSPPEAVASLLHIEKDYLAKCIWEPAAGDGAIVPPLQDAEFKIIVPDIVNYGLHDCAVVDHLKAKQIREVQGVVTNVFKFIRLAHPEAFQPK
jgi:hypothetical protein